MLGEVRLMPSMALFGARHRADVVIQTPRRPDAAERFMRKLKSLSYINTPLGAAEHCEMEASCDEHEDSSVVLTGWCMLRARERVGM
jgi:hypothetical protein